MINPLMHCFFSSSLLAIKFVFLSPEIRNANRFLIYRNAMLMVFCTMALPKAIESISGIKILDNLLYSYIQWFSACVCKWGWFCKTVGHETEGAHKHCTTIFEWQAGAARARKMDWCCFLKWRLVGKRNYVVGDTTALTVA